MKANDPLVGQPFEFIDLNKIISNDVIDKYTYSDSLQTLNYSIPEKYLLLSILERAFYDLQESYDKQSTSRKHKDLYIEVKNWFFNGNNKYIFSFENICGMFNLNKEYILENLTKKFNLSSV
jgi:hypothetical protein